MASAMFPLGTVLFPHAILPLHVFEPRYRIMTERCLEHDATFCVVLIERGSEVGGGDVRFDVGTRARIVQAGRFDDGRYALVAVGEQRVHVSRWLPDDPYPMAEVEPLDDGVAADAAVHVDDARRGLERVRALYAELGAQVPSTPVELTADDAARASFEAAALAPIGTLDAQRLLELDDAGERLERLVALLDEEARVLEFRLSRG
jgi:Lon protease-like protein